jgi:hypothetical protein
MKKQNRWFLIVGLLSLLAAAGGGLYAYRFYDSLVTTATAVTVARAVPPYTVLTPDLIVERDVPRGILQEPIYRTVEELAGRVTTTALCPDQLVYRHQAVPASEFRYAEDPALEVVSFPVDPERAVGGQIQIGHRVNVYRVRIIPAGGKVDRQGAAIRPTTEDTVVIPIEGKGAEAEVLAEGIPVVDVRAKQGEPANRPAVSSQIEQTARPESTKPLQILTVAVDHETALGLVELAVEEQGEYEIWVSLAPLAEPYEEEEKGMTYGK